MRLNYKEVAQGRWQGILVALGIDKALLTGKHTACPACGGKDRFRWDDRGGNGTFFCNMCGAGSGIDLVMRVKDCDFKTAAAAVEEAAGFVRPEAQKPGMTDADKIAALRRVWKASFPVEAGDPVSKYLTGRGLEVPKTTVLRYHPDLVYRDGESVTKHHAMLALVQAPDGSGASLHRTYLTFEGRKANVPSPKKIMPGLPISGAAVRLYEPGVTLGIAEGIETACAASMAFQMPVWAAVSAGGLESWIPPKEARIAHVFGDNDESFTGQRAAYALAARLRALGLEVQVHIPDHVGDWADEVVL